MSGAQQNQQPKLLLHKPKKSQRSPGATAQPAGSSASAAPSPSGSPLPKNPPSSSSTPPGETAAGSRGVSTSAGSPSPPGGGAKRPIWYRFRTAITTILVLNVAVLGYALFRSKATPQTSEEVQSTKEEAPEHKEDKLGEVEQDTNRVVAETTSHEPSLLTQEVTAQVQDRPAISREQQLELYKWMLAEKRKVKPANAAEKAQIDEEKALLKEKIRKKETL